MKLGWSRKRPDPVAQEVADQSARSQEVLARVERVLGKAVEIIEDYNLADRARLERRNP